MNTYKYTLTLQVKSNDIFYCNYDLELTETEEDDPAQLRQKVDLKRNDIFKILQEGLDNGNFSEPRCLNAMVLDELLLTWMSEILEGHFLTVLRRDVPIKTMEDLDNIQEGGSNYLPEFVPPDIEDVPVWVNILPPLQF